MEGDAAVGSIARAARVLDRLAAAPDGATLAQLVAATDFSKTTTHRVLSTLAGVQYVSYDPERRVYTLGSALARLAYNAKIVDVAAVAQRSMRRLAEISGDTVFFTIAEGAACVCIARELGAYPVRALTLDRGERMPLGVGGGALALYSVMSEARRAESNRLNARWLSEFDIDARALEAGRAFFFENGYSFNRGMVYPEAGAIGLPVITENQRLVGALSIGALRNRMSVERIEMLLLPALRDETAALCARLREAPGEPVDYSLRASVEAT